MTIQDETQTTYKSIIEQVLAEVEAELNALPAYLVKNRADFLLGYTVACRKVLAIREQSTKRMGNRKPLPALKAPVKVTK